jgi:hypothetical protein
LLHAASWCTRIDLRVFPPVCTGRNGVELRIGDFVTPLGLRLAYVLSSPASFSSLARRRCR